MVSGNIRQPPVIVRQQLRYKEVDQLHKIESLQPGENPVFQHLSGALHRVVGVVSS